MKKVLRQFRYYKDTDENNFTHPLNAPDNISKNTLKTGEIFFNTAEVEFATIVSLGIQTLPGVQFYLNDSIDTIIIGPTGIYELNLSDGYEIKALRFTDASLTLIENNPSAYLIIDVIYNVEE